MLMEKKERLENLKEKISKSSSDKILDGEFNSRPKIALVLVVVEQKELHILEF